MEQEYYCQYNRGVSCPFNFDGNELKRDIECKRCGWNPPIYKARKSKIVAMMRDKTGKTVRVKCRGFEIRENDYTPTLMTVRITTDEFGSQLSLMDERTGVAFMVPLEVVKELEEKNGL